jgi:hypothetical protein
MPGRIFLAREKNAADGLTGSTLPAHDDGDYHSGAPNQ